MLTVHDHVGIIACSDGLHSERRDELERLMQLLIELGLRPIIAETLFRKDGSPFSGSPQKRADELMRLFLNPSIKAIFDVSGGDSANQLLPYLNYDAIKKHTKPFFGLSDLTVLLNAIYHQTDVPTYHFQVMTLLYSKRQVERFKRQWLSSQSEYVLDVTYRFLRGNRLEGIVIGGNIRCFLKLAGTPYMPEPKGKILLLESLGGGPTRQASLIAQIDQMGIFKSCQGVLIGRFTEMEKNSHTPTIEELILQATEKYQLPIVKTDDIGHGKDGYCIPIGLPIRFVL